MEHDRNSTHQYATLNEIALTPMLSQYKRLKEEHPDSILLYRMGDFYEMFFEDAVMAAPVLEVQLTARDKKAKKPIPMCGVPHHAALTYIQKLVAAGLRVAICEQVEDPKLTKGLVKREVVRVMTPALVSEPDLVPEDSRNLLVGLHESTTKKIEVVLVDLLAGQVRAGEISSIKELLDLLAETPPKEWLISDATLKSNWFQEVQQFFPRVAITLRPDYFAPGDDIPASLNAVEKYLQETQKTDIKTFFQGSVFPLRETDVVRLDPTTLASLEILKNPERRDGTSLQQIVDRTTTSMGRRLLREWLARPLRSKSLIDERLDAVDWLINNSPVADDIVAQLKCFRDLERLSTKVAIGLANPRDLEAIASCLSRLPTIKSLLQVSESDWLRGLGERLRPLAELVSELRNALLESPPYGYREGGIFRDNYTPELAECRELTGQTKAIIARMENQEKQTTGISSLKIRYNKVFGYNIEVTTANLSKVPAHYRRKQTIAGGERFTTDELAILDEKISNADTRLKTLEEDYFLKLRASVAKSCQDLLVNARLLAQLDCALSFAQVSKDRGYCRPEIHTGWALSIEEGRHPTVEALMPSGQFVPNSVTFDERCQTLLITGPNMAGKSTIMRQVALITLLAHAGCFVPAKSAHLPLVDAIFTRIGSADDLSRGLSTFMVEMVEVARILEQASKSSLVIIDEIGRGTSTYDGLSLAWSILEHLHREIGAKTLFATHFHELTALEKSLPGAKNATVLVENGDGGVIFLHKLTQGASNRSYGVEVAKLAHLPKGVITRAKEILGVLEAQSLKQYRSRSQALKLEEDQMGFFDLIQPSENRSSIES